jgi:hypothetical protein
LARYERLEPRDPALQVVCLNVRIAHRGGQVSVSKEFLSDARINARSEESRSEVMAQVMDEVREVREPECFAMRSKARRGPTLTRRYQAC